MRTNSSDPTSNLEKALIDPSKVFKAPQDVLTHSGFSTADKIKILRRWEFDIREMEVAEEENMTVANKHKKVHLDDVLEALHNLDSGLTTDDTSPTKHGGE